jgi:hypothetical protein
VTLGAATLSLALAVGLGGCVVADNQYPLAWEPLPIPGADECLSFTGIYADRGERDDQAGKPSLTRELFGDLSDWESATRVQLEFPSEGVLHVSVLGEGGPIFSRKMLAGDGDFRCSSARLVVRDRRWIAGYILTGRQHVNVELNAAGRQVVAQVDELAYGMLFVIFPVAGTAKHWYRFARLE